MTDSEKLAALYRLYEKPLYRIAYAVLHDHGLAEDAVSEAFYRVMRYVSRLGAPDAPETRAYMIRVIRSTAFTQYRHELRQAEHMMPWDETVSELPDPSDPLEKRIERTSLLERLREMLGILSDTDRCIVVLHGRDGVPFSEIAKRLDMRESTVRKRYERARKRITSQFTKGEERYETQAHE